MDDNEVKREETAFCNILFTSCKDPGPKDVLQNWGYSSSLPGSITVCQVESQVWFQDVFR